MGTNTTRRKLLKDLALASAVLPGAATLWAQSTLAKNPFTLGVASGSATHDSLVLWTRLHDDAPAPAPLPNEVIPVRWELAADTGFARIVQAGTANAVPGLAHSVHVEVANLPANQWFFYRFRVGEHTSPVGRTRTFAAPGTAGGPLKIAVASCQHFELGYFNAYAHLVKEGPDLLLFMGDYIYEYPPSRSGVRTHVPGWCISLNDYRRRYAQYKQDPDLQRAHATCPWLVTTDDHEVQNDYAGTQEGSSGPKVDFAKRRAAAYQAFYEHMPMRASVLTAGISGLERGAEMRIYETYRLGNLVSVAMLDGRQYKDPQVCTPGNKTGSGHVDPKACDALADEARSLLGRTQEEWLSRQLQAAKGQTWNLIAQPTLFGACSFNTAEGPRIWNDGWDGYPAARKRLTSELVRHQVPNPVIVGGDVHENWVGYVKEDYSVATSRTLGVEVCGASISSFDGGNTQARQRRNPHFIFSDGSRKGYAMLEFSERDLRVHLRAVKDHKVRETEVEPLASFRVAAGTNRLEPLKA